MLSLLLYQMKIYSSPLVSGKTDRCLKLIHGLSVILSSDKDKSNRNTETDCFHYIYHRNIKLFEQVQVIYRHPGSLSESRISYLFENQQVSTII